MKRLTRSREHNALAGVLGGLGVYFNVDPIIFRLLFVILLIATGFFPGIFIYGAVWLILPLDTPVAPITPSIHVNDAPEV